MGTELAFAAKQPLGGVKLCLDHAQLWKSVLILKDLTALFGKKAFLYYFYK